MKYIGPLEKCPIIPAASAPDKFDRFDIPNFKYTRMRLMSLVTGLI